MFEFIFSEVTILAAQSRPNSRMGEGHINSCPAILGDLAKPRFIRNHKIKFDGVRAWRAEGRQLDRMLILVYFVCVLPFATSLPVTYLRKKQCGPQARLNRGPHGYSSHTLIS